MIVEEMFLPDAKKTIKPVTQLTAGVGGGQKYLSHGICTFRILDSQSLQCTHTHTHTHTHTQALKYAHLLPHTNILRHTGTRGSVHECRDGGGENAAGNTWCACGFCVCVCVLFLLEFWSLS